MLRSTSSTSTGTSCMTRGRVIASMMSSLSITFCVILPAVVLNQGK
uniref:Uncharacterized protein n=1 Tax=Arundo donax TaxID=35708 RepID=A0A0A8YHH7_ARUDO